MARLFLCVERACVYVCCLTMNVCLVCDLLRDVVWHACFSFVFVCVCVCVFIVLNVCVCV